MGDELVRSFGRPDIEYIGQITVSDDLRQLAVEAASCRSNSDTSITKNYDKTRLGETDNKAEFMNLIGAEKIDWVLFSCPLGALPHRDQLDILVHGYDTYVLPVLLNRTAYLHVGNERVTPKEGQVFKFKHQTMHSLFVDKSDKDTLCVFVMATILR